MVLFDAMPKAYCMIGNLLIVLALVTASPSASPSNTDAISPEEYAVTEFLNSRLIGSGI